MMTPLKAKLGLGCSLLLGTFALAGCVNYAPAPPATHTTTTETTTTQQPAPPAMVPPSGSTTTTTSQTLPNP